MPQDRGAVLDGNDDPAEQGKQGERDRGEDEEGCGEIPPPTDNKPNEGRENERMSER